MIASQHPNPLKSSRPPYEPLRLEVCVDDADGLHAAVSGGADRVELCAALALDGLSPSPGLMAMAAIVRTPVYAMIRPRPGDFVYSQRDVDVMKRDIDAVRRAGLAGVVLGASKAGGTLDDQVLATLAEHAIGLGTTLHRAIDLTPDMGEALEIAVALKFERILTSGGATTAEKGADRIADLVDMADGRIGIMAGSGITHTNLAGLIQRTGVTEIHASCSAPLTADPAARALGFVPATIRRTDEQTVAALHRLLQIL